MAGVKPMSRISLNATANISARTTARRTNGTPRLVCWAIRPPVTEPVSIAAPVTAWPHANTDSMFPVKPVAMSASTTHACSAPEKNVYPRPIRTDASAHAQNGAPTCQRST